jgi:hypothetical protein
MPDPRNSAPRTRQVQRHTTGTVVPPPAAGAVARSTAAQLRRESLHRIPELPLDEGNAHPPMPDPPTGDHSIVELAADDTSPASGTGQPDEDDKDKDERSRRLRREEDSDEQDAGAKADDGGAAKDPDPENEKPAPKS